MTIEEFEQDLREDLQRATSYAARSLPQVDVTTVVAHGAQVVRRRRIAGALGAAAAVAVVAVAVTAFGHGAPRADLRPATPSGVSVTRTGTVVIQDNAPRGLGGSGAQQYAVAYSAGLRGSDQVVDVRLRGMDGRTHELSYTSTEIARGMAVTWLDQHDLVALADPSTVPLVVSSLSAQGYPEVSTGSGTLPGLDVEVIVNHYRQTADAATTAGLVWQGRDGQVSGSPALSLTSRRVSAVGRTVDFWVSDRADRAGLFYPLGQLDVPWRAAGHLSALRDDDAVSERTILLVQVPAATVTLDTDATNPDAPHGLRPTSVTREGTSYWAAFETATLPKTSRLTWTTPDGGTGSGTVQAQSALG